MSTIEATRPARGDATVRRALLSGAFGGLRRRPVVLLGISLVILAIVFVLGIAIGTVAIAPTDTLAIIGRRVLGLPIPVTWSPTAETIVLDLRLPRVLATMTVGLGLAVAGATFQGLLRNPLADPYVLGTASGAALGAAVAIILPFRGALFEFGLLHVLAFVGALGATWTVYAFSRGSPLAPLTSLLLTGYAISSLLAAGLSLTMYLSGASLPQIVAFLLGGFGDASWGRLAVGFPIIILGSGAILVRARSINGLLLGEEAAAHLGVDVRRERAILTALASVVTAASVALAGLIGFVGLVVPHVVRLIVGPNARIVIPISAVLGAALLTSADLVARLLGDIPVGIVTAVIGAPFFLAVLRHTRAGYEL